ncbi:MAG: enoyl-CoA hydratase-related protein [Thermoleophilaceae bacterium]
MPTLDRDGEVFILNLGDGDNAFNPGWLDGVEGALTEVESRAAPRALVTTASGKTWSTGLDLNWLGANPHEAERFLGRVHALFARVLSLGVPTVAALQGHTFAAGAMLSLAHDHRVMRGDRGYWCLPEVDIRIPFTPGMSALVQARLPVQAAHEAMTTGRRYGGGEAAAAGIVAESLDEGKLLARATEIARPLASKDPGTLETIKQRMYESTLRSLRDATLNRVTIGASAP